MLFIQYMLHNARSSLRIPRRCDHTRRSPLAARRSPLAARRFIHVRAGRCMRSNSRGRCGRAASFGVKVRVDVGYQVRAAQCPLVCITRAGMIRPAGRLALSYSDSLYQLSIMISH